VCKCIQKLSAVDILIVIYFKISLKIIHTDMPIINLLKKVFTYPILSA